MKIIQPQIIQAKTNNQIQANPQNGCDLEDDGSQDEEILMIHNA